MDDQFGIRANFSFNARDAVSQIDRAISGLKELERAVRELDTQAERSGLGSTLTRQTRQAGASMRRVSRQTDRFAESMKQARRRIAPIKSEFQAIKTESRNIDFGNMFNDNDFKQAEAALERYIEDLKHLESQVERNTTVERKFAATLERQQSVARDRIEIHKGARDAARAAQRAGELEALGQTGQAVLAPMAAGMGSAIQVFAKFDDAMAGVAATSGASGKKLDKLRQQAKDLGSSTAFSASQAASAQQFLARAGFSANEVVEALPDTLALASAGNLELGEAADIASNALSAFGMDASETHRVTDTLAKVASTANTSVSQLGEAFTYAAPAASMFGASVEETAAMIGIAGNIGIQASTAGTGLRAGLINLTKKQQKFEKAFGVSLTDEKNVTRNIIDILGDLHKSLDFNFRDTGFSEGIQDIQEKIAEGTVGAEEQLDILKKKFPQQASALEKMASVFGKTAVGFWMGQVGQYEKLRHDSLQALASSVDEEALASQMHLAKGTDVFDTLIEQTGSYQGAVDELKKQIKALVESGKAGAGAAEAMAKIMEANLAGSFRSFGSALEGFRIAFVEPLVPVIRAVIDTAAQILRFLTNLPEPIRIVISLGVALTAATAALSMAVGTAGAVMFGFSQATSTAAVAQKSLMRASIPLTGFFEESMGAFRGTSPIETLIGTSAALRRDFVLTFEKTASRTFGAFSRVATRAATQVKSIATAVWLMSKAFLTSPLGIAIVSFLVLNKVLSQVVPGFDLLGTTVAAMVAPFAYLVGVVQGMAKAFREFIGESTIESIHLALVPLKSLADSLALVTKSLEKFLGQGEDMGYRIGNAIVAPLRFVIRFVETLYKVSVFLISNIIEQFTHLSNTVRGIRQGLVGEDDEFFETSEWESSLGDLMKILAQISKFFKAVTDSIIFGLSAIALVSRGVGDILLHSLAQGSPGTTQEIEDRWAQTTPTLQGHLEAIGNTAVEQGQLVAEQFGGIGDFISSTLGNVFAPRVSLANLQVAEARMSGSAEAIAIENDTIQERVVKGWTVALGVVADLFAQLPHQLELAGGALSSGVGTALSMGRNLLFGPQLSLADLNIAEQQINDRSQAVAEQNDQLQNKITGAWQSTQTSLGGTFSTISNLAVGAGDVLLHAFAEGSPGTTNDIKQSWHSLVPTAADVWDRLVRTFSTVRDALFRAFTLEGRLQDSFSQWKENRPKIADSDFLGIGSSGIEQAARESEAWQEVFYESFLKTDAAQQTINRWQQEWWNRLGDLFSSPQAQDGTEQIEDETKTWGDRLIGVFESVVEGIGGIAFAPFDWFGRAVYSNLSLAGRMRAAAEDAGMSLVEFAQTPEAIDVQSGWEQSWLSGISDTLLGVRKLGQETVGPVISPEISTERARAQALHDTQQIVSTWDATFGEINANLLRAILSPLDVFGTGTSDFIVGQISTFFKSIHAGFDEAIASYDRYIDSIEGEASLSQKLFGAIGIGGVKGVQTFISTFWDLRNNIRDAEKTAVEDTVAKSNLVGFGALLSSIIPGAAPDFFEPGAEEIDKSFGIFTKAKFGMGVARMLPAMMVIGIRQGIFQGISQGFSLWIADLPKTLHRMTNAIFDELLTDELIDEFNRSYGIDLGSWRDQWHSAIDSAQPLFDYLIEVGEAAEEVWGKFQPIFGAIAGFHNRIIGTLGLWMVGMRGVAFSELITNLPIGELIVVAKLIEGIKDVLQSTVFGDFIGFLGGPVWDLFESSLRLAWQTLKFFNSTLFGLPTAIVEEQFELLTLRFIQWRNQLNLVSRGVEYFRDIFSDSIARISVPSLTESLTRLAKQVERLPVLGKPLSKTIYRIIDAIKFLRPYVTDFFEWLGKHVFKWFQLISDNSPAGQFLATWEKLRLVLDGVVAGLRRIGLEGILPLLGLLKYLRPGKFWELYMQTKGLKGVTKGVNAIDLGISFADNILLGIAKKFGAGKSVQKWFGRPLRTLMTAVSEEAMPVDPVRHKLRDINNLIATTRQRKRFQFMGYEGEAPYLFKLLSMFPKLIRPTIELASRFGFTLLFWYSILEPLDADMQKLISSIHLFGGSLEWLNGIFPTIALIIKIARMVVIGGTDLLLGALYNFPKAFDLATQAFRAIALIAKTLTRIFLSVTDTLIKLGAISLFLAPILLSPWGTLPLLIVTIYATSSLLLHVVQDLLKDIAHLAQNFWVLRVYIQAFGDAWERVGAVLVASESQYGGFLQKMTAVALESVRALIISIPPAIIALIASALPAAASLGIAIVSASAWAILKYGAIVSQALWSVLGTAISGSFTVVYKGFERVIGAHVSAVTGLIKGEYRPAIKLVGGYLGSLLAWWIGAAFLGGGFPFILAGIAGLFSLAYSEVGWFKSAVDVVFLPVLNAIQSKIAKVAAPLVKMFDQLEEWQKALVATSASGLAVLSVLTTYLAVTGQLTQVVATMSTAISLTPWIAVFGTILFLYHEINNEFSLTKVIFQQASIQLKYYDAILREIWNALTGPVISQDFQDFFVNLINLVISNVPLIAAGIFLIALIIKRSLTGAIKSVVNLFLRIPLAIFDAIKAMGNFGDRIRQFAQTPKGMAVTQQLSHRVRKQERLGLRNFSIKNPFAYAPGEEQAREYRTAQTGRSAKFLKNFDRQQQKIQKFYEKQLSKIAKGNTRALDMLTEEQRKAYLRQQGKGKLLQTGKTKGFLGMGKFEREEVSGLGKSIVSQWMSEDAKEGKNVYSSAMLTSIARGTGLTGEFSRAGIDVNSRQYVEHLRDLVRNNDRLRDIYGALDNAISTQTIKHADIQSSTIKKLYVQGLQNVLGRERIEVGQSPKNWQEFGLSREDIKRVGSDYPDFAQAINQNEQLSNLLRKQGFIRPMDIAREIGQSFFVKAGWQPGRKEFAHEDYMSETGRKLVDRAIALSMVDDRAQFKQSEPSGYADVLNTQIEQKAPGTFPFVEELRIEKGKVRGTLADTFDRYQKDPGGKAKDDIEELVKGTSLTRQQIEEAFEKAKNVGDNPKEIYKKLAPIAETVYARYLDSVEKAFVSTANSRITSDKVDTSKIRSGFSQVVGGWLRDVRDSVMGNVKIPNIRFGEKFEEEAARRRVRAIEEIRRQNKLGDPTQESDKGRPGREMLLLERLGLVGGGRSIDEAIARVTRAQQNSSSFNSEHWEGLMKAKSPEEVSRAMSRIIKNAGLDDVGFEDFAKLGQRAVEASMVNLATPASFSQRDLALLGREENSEDELRETLRANNKTDPEIERTINQWKTQAASIRQAQEFLYKLNTDKGIQKQLAQMQYLQARGFSTGEVTSLAPVLSSARTMADLQAGLKTSPELLRKFEALASAEGRNADNLLSYLTKTLSTKNQSNEDRIRSAVRMLGLEENITSPEFYKSVVEARKKYRDPLLGTKDTREISLATQEGRDLKNIITSYARSQGTNYETALSELTDDFTSGPQTIIDKLITKGILGDPNAIPTSIADEATLKRLEVLRTGRRPEGMAEEEFRSVLNAVSQVSEFDAQQLIDPFVSLKKIRQTQHRRREEIGKLMKQQKVSSIRPDEDIIKEFGIAQALKSTSDAERVQAQKTLKDQQDLRDTVIDSLYKGNFSRIPQAYRQIISQRLGMSFDELEQTLSTTQLMKGGPFRWARQLGENIIGSFFEQFLYNADRRQYIAKVTKLSQQQEREKQLRERQERDLRETIVSARQIQSGRMELSALGQHYVETGKLERAATEAQKTRITQLFGREDMGELKEYFSKAQNKSRLSQLGDLLHSGGDVQMAIARMAEKNGNFEGITDILKQVEAGQDLTPDQRAQFDMFQQNIKESKGGFVQRYKILLQQLNLLDDKNELDEAKFTQLFSRLKDEGLNDFVSSYLRKGEWYRDATLKELRELAKQLDISTEGRSEQQLRKEIEKLQSMGSLRGFARWRLQFQLGLNKFRAGVVEGVTQLDSLAVFVDEKLSWIPGTESLANSLRSWSKKFVQWTNNLFRIPQQISKQLGKIPSLGAAALGIGIRIPGIGFMSRKLEENRQQRQRSLQGLMAQSGIRSMQDFEQVYMKPALKSRGIEDEKELNRILELVRNAQSGESLADRLRVLHLEGKVTPEAKDALTGAMESVFGVSAGHAAKLMRGEFTTEGVQAIGSTILREFIPSVVDGISRSVIGISRGGTFVIDKILAGTSSLLGWGENLPVIGSYLNRTRLFVDSLREGVGSISESLSNAARSATDNLASSLLRQSFDGLVRGTKSVVRGVANFLGHMTINDQIRAIQYANRDLTGERLETSELRARQLAALRERRRNLDLRMAKFAQVRADVDRALSNLPGPLKLFSPFLRGVNHVVMTVGQELTRGIMSFSGYTLIRDANFRRLNQLFAPLDNLVDTFIHPSEFLPRMVKFGQMVGGAIAAVGARVVKLGQQARQQVSQLELPSLGQMLRGAWQGIRGAFSRLFRRQSNTISSAPPSSATPQIMTPPSLPRQREMQIEISRQVDRSPWERLTTFFQPSSRESRSEELEQQRVAMQEARQNAVSGLGQVGSATIGFFGAIAEAGASMVRFAGRKANETRMAATSMWQDFWGGLRFRMTDIFGRIANLPGLRNLPGMGGARERRQQAISQRQQQAFRRDRIVQEDYRDLYGGNVKALPPAPILDPRRLLPYGEPQQMSPIETEAAPRQTQGPTRPAQDIIRASEQAENAWDESARGIVGTFARMVRAARAAGRRLRDLLNHGAADVTLSAWQNTQKGVLATFSSLSKTAKRVGARIVSYLNHAAADATAEAWDRTEHSVAEDMRQMEQHAAQSGQHMVQQEQRTATQSRSIFGRMFVAVAGMARRTFGAIGGLSRGVFAFGGAISSATFAVSQLTTGLEQSGAIDKETAEQLHKVTYQMQSFGGAIGAVVGMFGPLARGMKSVVMGLFPLIANPVGIAIAAVVGLAAVFWAFNEFVLKRFFDIDLMVPVSEAFNRLWAWMNETGRTILTQIAQVLPQPFVSAIATISGAWEGLSRMFGQIVQPMLDTAQTLGGKLIRALNCSPTEKIPAAWDEATGKVQESMNQVAETGEAVGDSLNKSMEPKKGGFWDFGGILKGAQNWISGGSDASAEAMKPAVLNYVDATEEALRRAKFDAKYGVEGAKTAAQTLSQALDASGGFYTADTIAQAMTGAGGEYLQRAVARENSRLFSSAGREVLAERGEAQQTIHQVEQQIDRVRSAADAKIAEIRADMEERSGFGAVFGGLHDMFRGSPEERIAAIEQDMKAQVSALKEQRSEAQKALDQTQFSGGEGLAQALKYDFGVNPEGLEKTIRDGASAAGEAMHEVKLQITDRLNYLKRTDGAHIGEIFEPGLQQVRGAVGLLGGDFVELGKQASSALFKGDVEGLKSAWSTFADNFKLSSSQILKGLWSMSMSTVALGVFGLTGLSPFALILGAIALAVLAVSVNFLGLRNIVRGLLKILVGFADALFSLLRGAVRAIRGIVKMIRAIPAALRGDFRLMREGFDQFLDGINIAARGFFRGITRVFNGIFDIAKGVLIAIKQVFESVLGTTLGSLKLGWKSVVTAFWRLPKMAWRVGRKIIEAFTHVGDRIADALDKPRQALQNLGNRLRGKKTETERTPAGRTVGAAIDAATGKAPNMAEARAMRDFDLKMEGHDPDAQLTLGDRVTQTQARVMRFFRRGRQKAGAEQAAQVSTSEPLDETERALDEAERSIYSRVDSASNAIGSLGNVMMNFAPAAAMPLFLITDLFDAFGALSALAPKLIASLGTTFTALSAGSLTLGAAATTAFTSIATSAKAAWASVSGPLLPVALGIGAILAGLWALKAAFDSNFGGFRDAVMSAVDYFLDGWRIFKAHVADRFMHLIGVIQEEIHKTFGPLARWFGSLGRTINRALQPFNLHLPGIKDLLEGIFKLILFSVDVLFWGLEAIVRIVFGLIRAFMHVGKIIYDFLILPIQSLKVFVGALATPFIALFALLRGDIDGALSAFQSHYSRIASALKTLGSLILGVFQIFWTPLSWILWTLNKIGSIVSSALLAPFRILGWLAQHWWQGLQQNFGTLLAISNFVGQRIVGGFNLWRNILGAIAQVIWQMTTPIRWTFQFVSRIIGAMWNLREAISGSAATSSAFGQVWNTLISPISTIANIIKFVFSLVQKLFGALSQMGGMLWNAVSTPFKFLGNIAGGIVDRVGNAIGGLAHRANAVTGGVLGKIGGVIGGVGSAIGGAIGGVGSAIGGALGFAEGGPVRGPGSSTGDRIPAMLSNGEYVVNAKSARSNLGLLEAINRGAGYLFDVVSDGFAPLFDVVDDRNQTLLSLVAETFPAMAKAIALPSPPEVLPAPGFAIDTTRFPTPPAAAPSTPAQPPSIESPQINVNFSGDIVLQGADSAEAAEELMEKLDPHLRMAIDAYLRERLDFVR